MPFAVTLRFDAVSAASIEDLARAVRGADGDCDGYAPHITLAIYPDDVCVDRLRSAFADVTAGWRVQSVRLGAIGVFPGPLSIVWAAPVVTVSLLALHASVIEALPEVPAHPHYRVGDWVPHVTLADAVSWPDDVLAEVVARWRPVSGVLAVAELVRFHPVEVLLSHALTL
jgi:2'-5' RNA ligase